MREPIHREDAMHSGNRLPKALADTGKGEPWGPHRRSRVFERSQRSGLTTQCAFGGIHPHVFPHVFLQGPNSIHVYPFSVLHSILSMAIAVKKSMFASGLLIGLVYQALPFHRTIPSSVLTDRTVTDVRYSLSCVTLTNTILSAPVNWPTFTKSDRLSD